MDPEKLLEEIKQFLQFDELNLKEKQLMLPSIKHRYATIFIRTKMQLGNLYTERKRTIRTIVDEINKESAIRLSVPAAEKLASDHETIADIDSKIRNCEVVLEICEKSEKILSSASYDIKNLVELIKLETN
jgi:hypothetical protein